MRQMKKITALMVVLFFMLSACAQADLLIDEPVTSIKVYEYNTDTLLDSIEDEDLINELVKKLNKAKTASTATYDFELPAYELAFKNKDDEEVLTLGYFTELVNLGVSGCYWDGNQDVMYGVELQLPVKIQ